MQKKYYSQVYVDKYLSEQKLAAFMNDWNQQQQDLDGNYPKGAKRLRDIHTETYSALLVLLIKKTIARQNKINKVAENIVPYNVSKPFILSARPYEIKNMMVKGVTNAISLQTVKNRMDRLELAGVISRKWKRGTGQFEIEFYHEFLSLKNPEDDKIIVFENDSKSIDCKTKNENLPCNTNDLTNKNNKIIQSEIVDKMCEQSSPVLSDLSQHLDSNNKKCNQQETLIQQPTSKLQPDGSKTKVARERSEDIILKNQKKSAANRIYDRLIAALWGTMLNFYMLNTSDKRTLNYVAQSIETLINDDFYFGACKNEKHIQYQESKLNAAINSAHNWYKSKKRDNENFELQYLYPNKYLKNNTEDKHMSFKKSVLHVEIQMLKNNSFQMDIEKAIQKERDKKRGEQFNQIISQVIAYIYLNPKSDTQKLILQAVEYLRKIHPELVQKFNTDIKNNQAVTKILDAHKSFDKQLIAECFEKEQLIEKEINLLLPVMQKLLLSRKLFIDQKMQTKFKFRGAEMVPVPMNYNLDTLKALKFYTK